MTEVLLPVLTEAITRELEDPRSPVRPLARGGKDEKPAVLSDEVSTPGDLPGAPLEQAIAELEVEGSRAKRQQGDPLATVEGDVAENLADRGGIVEAMLTLHEEVKGLPFFASDEPHGDLLQKSILCRKPGNGVVATAVGHPRS